MQNTNNIFQRSNGICVGFVKVTNPGTVQAKMNAIEAKADKLGVKLACILVDEWECYNVRRRQITELKSWMKEDMVSVIIVNSVFDITNTAEDLESFLRFAQDNYVICACTIHLNVPPINSRLCFASSFTSSVSFPMYLQDKAST